MRFKIITLASFMMLCGTMLFAQIRDYVFIVRPVYNEEMSAFIDSTVKTLNDKGYKDLGAIATAQKKGGFGSGFLYTSQDNRKFVITNRHVVGDSSTITLELEAANGTKQTFEGNKIIAVDDEVDLAIVEITAKNSFTQGLKLVEARPADGADAWTAGYPGLGATPSWQLGKGVITNSHARIKELVDPAKSDLIQHSAQIDGGNSGGPLLITDKTAVTGYAVIGVNTWKARYRQAANYSLPVAPALKNFIEKSFNSKTSDKEAGNLKERIDDFSKVSSIKNEDDPGERMRSIARFISRNCVMQSGESSLLAALSSAPSKIRNEILWTFESSLFDAMRLSIAYDIDKKLNDEKNPVAVTAPDLQKSSINTASTEVVFLAENSGEIITSWKEENNMWRLDAMQSVTIAKNSDKEESDKKTPSKFEIYNPFDTIFFLEYDFSFSNHDAAGFGYISYPIKFFGWGFGLTISYLSVDIYPDDFSSVPGDKESVKTWSARPVAIARIQVPFNGPSFSVTPFIEARAGAQLIFEFNVIDPPAGIYASGSLGVQLGFTHMFIGISGGVEKIVNAFGEYAIDPKDTLSGLLTISVGWGY